MKFYTFYEKKSRGQGSFLPILISNLVVLTPFAHQKATDRIRMGIFASSLLFHRCTCLSLGRYHTVLVLEAL